MKDKAGRAGRFLTGLVGIAVAIAVAVAIMDRIPETREPFRIVTIEAGVSWLIWWGLPKVFSRVGKFLAGLLIIEIALLVWGVYFEAWWITPGQAWAVGTGTVVLLGLTLFATFLLRNRRRGRD
jgi:hypothetical protein